MRAKSIDLNAFSSGKPQNPQKYAQFPPLCWLKRFGRANLVESVLPRSICPILLHYGARTDRFCMFLDPEVLAISSVDHFLHADLRGQILICIAKLLILS
jgi:hypothetical protein